MRGIRSLAVLAAPGGNGNCKWEKGSGSVAGNILLPGGGVTELIDSSFTSTTRNRIFTPNGGSCNGSSISLFAPIAQVCRLFDG
ncbi:MAG: hypothetical protein JNL62_06830 [Bryobacterales bacterium]|nr:hypothetical protein [Bryobacterales bacterium]